MNNLTKNLILWLVIAMVLMAVFNNFTPRDMAKNQAVEYSTFLEEVTQGRVERVTIQGQTIHGRTITGQSFVTYAPDDPGLVEDLMKSGVVIEAKAEDSPSFLAQLLIHWFPLLLIIGVWIYLMRQMQGGGGRGALSFGKSRARMLTEENNKVTFEDVAGVEEAKEEVSELVEFLRDPSKFQKLGGRIPRGVLMTGSPGTGKTLLAKAIAGEAKVPFFTISGS
ncbi:MAG: ATP-dependent metallopeptidase FtsH/Yme1/Tma family protein, partial [Gammaproteobacteria bacterium]|nr:ATP-dependent metallopeptidase FtsH/Yme1/Tma family protein [Gammaproteobacteria bacterium]